MRIPKGVVWIIVVHQKMLNSSAVSAGDANHRRVETLGEKSMLALVLPLPEILFLAESMSLILELANQKECGKFASLGLLALSTHLLLKEFINSQAAQLGGMIGGWGGWDVLEAILSGRGGERTTKHPESLVGLVLAMVETIYNCAQLCWMRTGEESANTTNTAKKDFWLMLVASVLTQTRRMLFVVSSLSWIGKNE